MGFFDKLKSGLNQTHSRLLHEIKRVVSRSPRLTSDTLEELEFALISADLGSKVTGEIIAAVKRAYETQGANGVDVLAVAAREVEQSLGALPNDFRQSDGLTVASVVGVNGTGKTTTAAKLAYWFQEQGRKTHLGACDTFRAAAIDQLKLWGKRLQVPVTAGAYGSDPAAVAHDALSAALSKEADLLILDTAGRLHTKQNLMQELQKLHRVIDKKLPGAPHETLLVLDATTGMNALNQAREFHNAVALTGLVVTKLDGTSKGGMVVAVQRELGVPVKFVGLGEQPEDLQPFRAEEFAQALFQED